MLHRPGEPLILFNVWDAGSAKAVASAGAAAIATGSVSVAGANGFEDAETLPLALALANAERIVAVVELPVTVDFEGGYALEAEPLTENFRILAATGAIGANFEDRIVGGEGLHSIDRQFARIQAAVSGTGAEFFLNARTDLFLAAPREAHDRALVDAALERVAAYAEAGARGFFVPGLARLDLFERICARSPLPVNFMAFPGCPSKAELASAGAARISHGPFPWIKAMKQLGEEAKLAFG